MPLPGSGPISMNDVNTEIRKPATSQREFNDADVRLTFNKPSEDISLNDGYGECFCDEYSIIYDNIDNTVDFTALECNEGRTATGLADTGTGGNPVPGSPFCIVKGSLVLGPGQNPLNYTRNGCC